MQDHDVCSDHTPPHCDLCYVWYESSESARDAYEAFVDHGFKDDLTVGMGADAFIDVEQSRIAKSALGVRQLEDWLPDYCRDKKIPDRLAAGWVLFVFKDMNKERQAEVERLRRSTGGMHEPEK